MATELSSTVLRELLRYEPDTGKLFWLVRDRSRFQNNRSHAVWNGRYANTEAFTCDTTGRRTGRIFDRQYLAHRVIWALHTGEWPVGEIDHIDGNSSNNRWINLRDVSHAENMKNTKLHKSNTSGRIGVSFNRRMGMWNAYIGDRSDREILGYFPTMDLAASARSKAEVEHGYHRNHGRTEVAA